MRPDTAYLLYAAGRVLDGARLYVDVVEINPPLIVGLNLPAVLVARATGASELTVLRILVMLALLASLRCCAWSLEFATGPEGRLGRLLLLLFGFALFIAPGDDFGQREHLLVAFTLPYLLLAAGRIEGRPASKRPAFAAGLLAGLGLALKPHFLLVWAAVEGYAAWRTRARRPAPEAFGVLALLLLYALATMLLTPEYLRLVTLLAPVYNAFGHYPWALVAATAPGGAGCLLAGLTFGVLHRRARHPALSMVLLLALAAAYVAGAAQQKGWTYHFLPARILGLILLGLILADLRRPVRRLVERIYAVVALAVLTTALIAGTTVALLRASGLDPVRERQRAQLERDTAAVRRHVPPGGILYAFSYTINTSFPLVNYSGVRWASRFPHLWMLEALYDDKIHETAPLRFTPQAEMGAAERYLNDAVAEDLTHNLPDLLMVLRNARDVPANAVRRIDYLAYFERDRRIAAALSAYRWVEDYGPYRLYVRRTASAPGTPPGAEPGRLDVRRSPGPAWAIDADPRFLLQVGLFLLLLVAAGVTEARRAQRADGADGHDGA